jgi:hypothetical protein
VLTPDIHSCEAKASHRTRRQVVDEDVCAGEQFPQHVDRFGLLQVERQRLFRAVQPDEVARHTVDGRIVAACEIADVGALDLDDTRAEIRKLPRRERRSDCLLDRNNRNTCKRKHRIPRQELRTTEARRARRNP